NLRFRVRDRGIGFAGADHGEGHGIQSAPRSPAPAAQPPPQFSKDSRWKVVKEDRSANVARERKALAGAREVGGTVCPDVAGDVSYAHRAGRIKRRLHRRGRTQAGRRLSPWTLRPG